MSRLRIATAGMTVVLGAIVASSCSSTSSTSTATTAAGTTTSAGAAATTTAGATATTTAAATTTTKAGATATAAATTATTVATSTGSSASVADVAVAGTAFLALLDSAEKSAGVFEYSNTTQKAKWSNFPNSIFPRSGIQWGNLSAAKQTAWLAMVQKSLSAEGYNRFLEEWKADDALAAAEGGNSMFGSNLFYIALIGTPSAATPWMYQFGGHHVTLNVTVAGGRISPVPSFVGDQPASYTDTSGKTIVPLGDISADAYALVASLDATQQAAAVLGTSVIDVVLGPGQDGKTIATEGLLGSKMTAAQQATFLKLIMHYAGMANDAETAKRLAEIKTDLASTAFAWYGPTTAGGSAYFRVTGPTVVIEYSPQGAGRNATATTGAPTHIHGVYRDPTNDYGNKYDG